MGHITRTMHEFELTNVSEITTATGITIYYNVSTIEFTTIIAHTDTFRSPSYTYFDADTCVLSVQLSDKIHLQTVLIPKADAVQFSVDYGFDEDSSVPIVL